MEDPGPEIAGHKRTVELCGRGSWSEMEGPIVPFPHLLNTPRHMTGKFVPFLGAHYLASRPQLSCLIVVISSSYSTRAFFSSCADRLFWWNASGNFLPRPFFSAPLNGYFMHSDLVLIERWILFTLRWWTVGVGNIYWRVGAEGELMYGFAIPLKHFRHCGFL